ncbi:ABC transporter ATP-binding protein [bacterium]|nr:ABC transporter ATP-binding protein [candidate division CSSED10-310 bacterium]
MNGILADLCTLMGKYRKTYVLSGVALVAATGFQLVFPWVLRCAIDGLNSDPGWRRRLFIFCLLLCGSASGEALFTYLKGRWASAASAGTIRDLRNHIFRHLMHLPVPVLSDLQTGDVIQRSTSDVQTIERFLSNQVTEVARTLCLLFGVGGLMFVMDARLATYALSVIPPIFLFSLQFFGRIRRRFEHYDEAEAALSTRVQEFLSGVRVVKAFARESYERDKFNNIDTELLNQDLRLTGLHAFFWPVSDMLCMLQVVIVLIAGGLRTISGDISMGVFVAFNSYVMFLVWPVRHVGRLLGEMGRASVSIMRIREILDLPSESLVRDVTGITRFKGSIEFRDVGFAYKGFPILKNISFRVEPGQTVAILGATGSGKTTLVQLMTRFFDDYRGLIMLDGRDIREIPKSVLRAQVGMVMQESFLFSRTIFQNIAFGLNDVDEHRVRDAAATAEVDRFVNDLPDGYASIVGERGVTLSGGQKQRVALARVLLNDPSVLILDDTTSALDTETEMRVCEALKRRQSGRTAFIVTHRLSAAASADLIIAMEDGRIVQKGSPMELESQDGYYRRLHTRARLACLNKETPHAGAKKRRNRISQTI